MAPVFGDSNGDFVLILYNLNYDVTQGETVKTIQNLIRANSKITTEEMAKRLGVTKRTVLRKIEKMPNVHYVGEGYCGHWGSR